MRVCQAGAGLYVKVTVLLSGQPASPQHIVILLFSCEASQSCFQLDLSKLGGGKPSQPQIAGHPAEFQDTELLFSAFTPTKLRKVQATALCCEVAVPHLSLLCPHKLPQLTAVSH